MLSSGDSDGKKKAALEILKQMYGPHMKWKSLVESMKDQVVKDRLERGVGLKPQVKKREEWEAMEIDQIKMAK